MKMLKTLAAFLLALLMAGGPSALLAQEDGDIVLPPPLTEGGMGLFEALKKRSSAPGGDFSMAPVSLEQLSTILWAASGLNRAETGWTVPMADGTRPYVRIYVVGTDGAYRYEWSGHKLALVTKENIKARIGGPGFSKKASYILILASEAETLATLKSKSNAEAFANVLTGAMTQDIYLAAAALKLGARYVHAMNYAETAEALKLAPGDKPICLMLLGN
jgi:hypothetical protein